MTDEQKFKTIFLLLIGFIFSSSFYLINMYLKRLEPELGPKGSICKYESTIERASKKLWKCELDGDVTYLTTPLNGYEARVYRQGTK